MDDECSLQDVARCHLCETPEPSLHCNICDKHLCKNCEEKHIGHKPPKHKVVPFKERMIRPKCQKHSFKKCELHCKPCDIPLCVSCVSSEEHKQHEIVDILIYFEKNKKNVSQTNLQESKITTYPKKQEKKPSFKQQTTEKMKRMFNKHRERMIPMTIVLSVFVIAVVLVVVVASRERLGN